MSISFSRHLSENECISGTRMSAKGLQSMTSTGIPSMDYLFGGGLPLNSITLFEEDNCSQYSSLMAKCFVADSVDSKHKTIISSQTITSKKSRFLRELPVRSAQPQPTENSSEDIRIAWRYKTQPLVANTSLGGQQFDLGSHPSEPTLSSADIAFCSHNSCLHLIASLEPKDNKTVTRVLIEGLGGPLSPVPIEQLPKFVFELKLMMRRMPNILCLMTFSSQLVLLSNYSYVRSRVHNIVDSCVQLIAFDESSQTPYTEFNGLFNVIKLPKLNSFNYYMTPETLDFGFQLKNNSRFLVIDKLCLPPDLSDTVSRTTGCATGSMNTNLDF